MHQGIRAQYDEMHDPTGGPTRLRRLPLWYDEQDRDWLKKQDQKPNASSAAPHHLQRLWRLHAEERLIPST
jgi:hypothetical protein